MPTPANRAKIQLVRGSYANILAGLPDLVDGELCYAKDQNKLYMVEGAALTPLDYLANTDLTETVQDIIGAAISGGVGLSSAYNDTTGLTTIDLDNTAVTPGIYGSASAIPAVTVDQQGRITSITTNNVGSDLAVSADAGASQVINLLTETLAISGADGITTTTTTNGVSIDLDNTAVTPGTYGSSTAVPSIIIDQQGRITSATTNTVLTDLVVAADTGTNQTISLGTETLTISGADGITTTATTNNISIDLDNTTVTPGTYGDGDTVGQFIVDQQGRITSATDVNISIAHTAISDWATANINTSGTLSTTNATASTSSGTGALVVAGGVGIGGNVNIGGSLTVTGTTVTLDAETLLIEDKNIEMGVVATPSDVTADGGGITLRGATNKTINWLDATDAWTFSEHINIASAKEYRIAGTKVLDATSLGSAVVSSSLTSVGTISSGTWNGSAIVDTYLGTISTAGKVSNSATTATDANTASAIVSRDASHNFTAGTITAALTGTASNNLPLAGGTLTGNVILDNQVDARFREATANGTNYVGFQAPSSIAADVLWTLPNADAAVSGYALVSDASGTLSWAAAAGGGATGGSTDKVFFENDQTVTTSYTLTANKNAVTAGPVTINSSITVTIPSGSSWVVV